MTTNAQASWDDIRYVLAVADHGSVAAAARELGVNHATVLRRIAAFETREGLRVFDKTPRGYQVSPDRRSLVEAMREAGDAFGHVDRMIEAERPRMTNAIRLTSTDTFSFALLPPLVSDLSADLDTPVEIVTANTHLDLARFQAHITVRPALTLPPELSGDCAGTFRFGVYAAQGGDDVWLGLSGPLGRSMAGDWMRARGGGARLASDSFLMLASLVALGRGRALLPVFFGDIWPGIERIDMPHDLAPVPVWVASHRDYARSGRLRRVRKVLLEGLTALGPQMMGEVDATAPARQSA